MAIFVRMLLASSLACICVCKAGEEGQNHWAVAMGMEHQADRVERKSDDGKGSAEEISTGNRKRRSLTESERTDSVTTINSLRRTLGSSNMPYLPYDVEAENFAASWTSFCDFNRAVNRTGGYVNWFYTLNNATKTIPTVIRGWFQSYTRSLSSVYLTSFGCDLNRCSSATANGKTYENAELTLCAFKGGSEYDASRVQFRQGEGCIECNSGSFWCDNGLCRADCAASDSCYCNAYCLNCADTNKTTCRCQCLAGWAGPRCQQKASTNATIPACSTITRARTTLTTKNLNNTQLPTTASLNDTKLTTTASLNDTKLTTTASLNDTKLTTTSSLNDTQFTTTGSLNDTQSSDTLSTISISSTASIGTSFLQIVSSATMALFLRV